MKAYKNVRFLAVLGLIFGIFLLYAFIYGPSANAAENVSSTATGFHQFNNLEIFKSPSVNEPPTTVEAIQKNEKTNENNSYLIQIEERTTLLGVNQEPALLSDFQAGDKINVSGWLSADSKTIRAAVMRDLSVKDYHQSFSGTIKKVTNDGFTLTLANGDEVFVKTPLVEGSQITIKGVFDKTNSVINSVLSILVRPNVVLQEKPAPKETESSSEATPSAKPSTLFKNFLRVFGL